MKYNSKIYIAGHEGMVGSAILRNLKRKGYNNFVYRTFKALDLTQQAAVKVFFEKEKPEYVIIAAAKVGGIHANNFYRGQFIYENLQIQNNIIHHAYLNKVKKLLFLGSSCIYPKDCPQPIKEEYLLTGKLEYTNEPYAISKIAGLKLCESYYKQYGCNFISVMPTNLYGPNDNYDLKYSHVMPAIIRKTHLAKCIETRNWNLLRADLNKRPLGNIDGKADEKDIIKALLSYGIKTGNSQPESTAFNLRDVTVVLWGSGNPRREFMHVDDMADACVHILNKTEAKELYDDLQISHINIGLGVDINIGHLSEMIKDIIGFSGKIDWDHTMPDGTFQKLLDVSVLNNFRWENKTSLQEGIQREYNTYLKEIGN